VLSAWGPGSPGSAKGIDADEAAARLGFEQAVYHYRRIDAAVAFIVLGPVDIHRSARKAATRWMAAAKLVSVLS
jgi:hypothetical protein